MAAGFDVDAFVEQGRDILGERFSAANVRDCDLSAAMTQKQSRGQTGFSQSHDQHLFAFELHHWNSSSGLRDYFYCALRGVARGPGLTQFQCCECKQCKHEGADPETDDNFGFVPAQLLEMVVQRGHLEDTLFPQLVAADLEDDGDRFNDENSSDEGEQKLLADDDSDGADGPAEGKRTDVAHEDFSGVGVVPEKPNGSADHGSAKDGQLGYQRHALQLKVVGKDDVTADVGEHGQRGGGDDGAADGKAVEPVSEIDCVGGTHEHKDHENDKGQEDQKAEMRDGRNPMPLQIGAKVLKKRYREIGRKHFELIELDECDGYPGGNQTLPQELSAGCKAEVALLHDLNVVIGKADGAKSKS